MYLQIYNIFDLACSVYNNVNHPSKLTIGADFHCFKNKIEPKWEDPICANGGKWTVTFQRGKSDTCWLYTVCFILSLLKHYHFKHSLCPAVCREGKGGVGVIFLSLCCMVL